jgi:hypothetical protein
MRPLYSTVLALSLLSATVHAGGSKKNNPSGIEAWLAGQRVEAINDMAPRIGLDPKTVLRSSATFKPCEHTGKNNDGPYVDGSKTACPEIKSSVHAWCMPNPGARVRFMFAIVSASESPSKEVMVWCVRHEEMHELLAYYEISGHPLKVTITRKDNGKSQTFKPAEIINGRWPSMVNAFIPEGMESQDEWADAACGTEEVMLGDGEGI